MPLATPSKLELNNIRALLSDPPQGRFSGRKVLEIGAGAGRLAWVFAPEAAVWVGLDLDEAGIGAAAQIQRIKNLPALRLLVNDGRALSFPAEAFDVVFFSWCLCCFPPADMALAVGEAERVLQPGGLLLDLHPTEDPLALEVWHAGYSGNGQPDEPDAIHRLPVGFLDSAGPPHGFADATDALAAALEGNFTLLCTTAFEYRYFFDSVDELTSHLKDNHEHATPSAALLEQARAVLKQSPVKPKLVTLQRIAATSLQKT